MGESPVPLFALMLYCVLGYVLYRLDYMGKRKGKRGLLFYVLFGVVSALASIVPLLLGLERIEDLDKNEELLNNENP